MSAVTPDEVQSLIGQRVELAVRRHTTTGYSANLLKIRGTVIAVGTTVGIRTPSALVVQVDDSTLIVPLTRLAGWEVEDA